MKRTLLFVVALATLCTTSLAQGLDQPWWSVRGGVTFSNLSSPNYSTDYLTGYSLGVTYAYPLSSTIPIYIEAGLYFNQEGARDNGFLTDSGSDSKLTKQEFKIPVLVGYQVPIAKDWNIQSFLGLYYSVAVNGKFEVGDVDFDPFKKESIQMLRDSEPVDQRLLQRSDLGIRVGLSVLYKKYLFGFSFDGGLLNTYSRDFRDAGYQALTGCFTIQLGYNF